MDRNYRAAPTRVPDLSEETIRTMATLYLQNFDGSSEALFRSDLAEKDDAILLHCDRRLVGFTTLKLFERTWKGQSVRVIFSGDTIVSPEHWGQQELAFSWISHVGRLKRAAPAKPLIWFLLVKGHRTYKYLSVFGKSFFPHWSQERSDLKSLADLLARERFADDYRPQTGLVEFPVSHGHLKEEIAYATAEEMKKPATRFFFERNPGYRQGHELVCICELETQNMRPLAARIFQRDFDGPRSA